MKFSYNWLKELTGWPRTPDQLAHLLTLGVFEMESITKTGKDYALDVKILPNRVADASGHRGLAREIINLSKKRPVLHLTATEGKKTQGTKLKLKVQKLKEDTKKQVSSLLRVRIDNSTDCPRYTARVIDGVKIGPSPAWMRERLETCGLQSINNVVDAANYAMLETGQPMHVFDYEALKTGDSASRTLEKSVAKKSIIVRRAKAGEKLLALDGEIYALSPDILVIADVEEPLALAGIKGGQYSGIHEGTKTVILESANFNPAILRSASQALRLRTDASYRFEHGLDPNETAGAIDILAALIQKVAGGVSARGTVDVFPMKARPVHISFRPAYANDMIGIPLSPGFYKKTLEMIGCMVKSAKNGWIVQPPTVRQDLVIEEDLIEEVARLSGYTEIPSLMPLLPIMGPRRNDAVFYRDAIRDILAGAGFIEHYVYEFTGERELADFGINTSNAMALENPTSPETAYLLTRPLIKYISAAHDNLKHGDAVRFFGFAKNFTLRKKGIAHFDAVIERTHLCAAVAIKNSDGAEAFYELKGAVDHVLESLGISDYIYDDARREENRDAIFHSMRIADIRIGETQIGRIGEVHPAVREPMKAQERIAGVEIFYDALWSLVCAEQEYAPISKYPAVMRDLAIVALQETRIADIVNAIEAAGGKLLVDTDLFDDFQDEGMRASGEKSFAFHLMFQSLERTLTDSEIDGLMAAIVVACEERGWTIRQ